MYWYYKVILLAVVGAVLYGLFSLISPFLPEIPSFSTPDAPVEEKAKDTTATNTAAGSQSGANSTATPKTYQQPRPKILAQKLNAAQQAKLTEAKDLYLRHQRTDDAFNIAIKLLEDPNIPQLSKAWYEVADFIAGLNTKLFFSSAPSDRKENHQVKSGDSLSRIAGNYTTIRGLQLANNIPLDSGIIHPGDVIRYFSGKWAIEVIKSEYILILYQNGQFFKYYNIGVGKEDRTPEGKFKIHGKVEDPIWERKGQSNIAPGDPQNVLGTRWMKLKAMEGTLITGSGYGIHGTTQPNSIGTPASQGCIRMINQDVEELFDIIPDIVVEVLIRK
jgi:hypothetical protein